MGILTRLLLNALSLLIVAWLFDGISFASGLSGITAAIWAAVLLGLINLTIKPVIKFFAIPVNFITLGLFGLVINALMLKTVAFFTPGFYVNGFFAAFFGAIVLAIVSSVLNLLAKKD